MKVCRDQTAPPSTGSRGRLPIGRPGPWRTGLWSLPMIVIVAACGGQPSTQSGTPPQPTRRVIDISGYQRLEIFNEPSTAARTIQFALDDVWAALPAVLDGMGISPTFIDPQSRVIGNQGFRMGRVDGARPNTFIDCGSGLSGPLANLHEVTLSVLVSLTAEGEATVVQTTVDANARPRAVSGNAAHCQSRGELELRVTNKVLEALGGATSGT